MSAQLNSLHHAASRLLAYIDADNAATGPVPIAEPLLANRPHLVELVEELRAAVDRVMVET
jgi:hypothetical protein